MDWIFSALFFLALFVVILLVEMLRKKLGWSTQSTRKIVHLITGVFVSVTPFLFQSRIPIIILSIFFAVFNFLAIKKGYFPGLHATGRKSYGTVFYPVALVILLFFLWDSHQLILVISILVLAFADPAAAIVGEKLTARHDFYLASDKKSIEGSLAMLGTSLLIVFFGLQFGSRLFDGYVTLTMAQNIWIAIIVAVTATVSEALSAHGSDNLTIPLSVAFFLHFMISRFGSPAFSENIQLTLGLTMAAFIAILTFYLHFISASGAVGTFLLGTVVFGVGGWKFSLPILTFFILSSLLSRLGKTEKKKLAQTFQKSSRRDIGQVLANGGLAGLIVLIWNFHQSDIWFALYLGALGSVTADTWATEIGFFSKKIPRLILNFNPVPPGTSGGLTALGSAAAVVGAATIAAAGWLSSPDSRAPGLLFLLVVVAGLFACMFDSLLGATIQAQFQCPQCQKITEKTVHCQNVQTDHISGCLLIENDLVNFLASIFGVLIVWAGGWFFL